MRSTSRVRARVPSALNREEVLSSSGAGHECLTVAGALHWALRTCQYLQGIRILVNLNPVSQKSTFRRHRRFDIKQEFATAIMDDATTESTLPSSSSSTSPAPPSKEEARQRLESTLKKKRVSLTPAEAAFLSALLLDASEHDEEDHATQMNLAAKRLDNDMLFQTPFVSEPLPGVAHPPKCRRAQSNSIGLWKAFEEGVRPNLLVLLQRREARERRASVLAERRKSQVEKEPNDGEDQDVDDDGDDDDEAAASDEEVRTDLTQYKEDIEFESWDEDDEAPEHFDAWKVLKDEYAKDHGFDYNKTFVDVDDFDEHEAGNIFRILGTSADDTSAHPHVLSPPLMDSLMNHFPNSVKNENFWLKFSLVRDGASFDTLKHYIRGATHTILAVETTKGHVFGSFTSSPWRTHNGYYGTGEAFLWRMRHSRKTKVHSLLDQAQLETKIDVYPFSGLNEMVQLCTYDMIAVGGGQLDEDGKQKLPVGLDPNAYSGFGFAINDDLLNGSTSPCATFCNKCLVGDSSEGEIFQVVNLECWSLTPCMTVDSAEKLEMTQFFVNESSRSISDDSVISQRAGFSSRDQVQSEFYRQVGKNDRSQEGRDRFQYAAMMGTQGLR